MTGPCLGRRALLLLPLLLAALGGIGPVDAAADDTEARLVTCLGEPGTIWATATADVAQATKGTSGPDVIIGSAGNDIIFGRGGDDLICGNGGHDMIFGEGGRDRVQGGPGNDILYGDAGRDTLLGGPGGNILNGGLGTDRCLSGDTYVSCELPPVDKILAECPTTREIARIDAELNLTFEADPTAGVFACTPAQGSLYLTPLKKRAYNAVRIMERIPFDAALPWTPYELQDWFTRAITGIRFRGDISFSFCCDPPGVINLRTGIASEETDKWMRYPFDLGIAHLVLLMAHEARHNEGFPHTCNYDPSVPGYIDDQAIGEMGAWAVQYYLEEWFAEHTPQAFLAGPPGHRSFYQDQSAADLTLLAHRFCTPP